MLPFHSLIPLIIMINQNLKTSISRISYLISYTIEVFLDRLKKKKAISPDDYQRLNPTSSSAGRGARAPPHWPVKYAKSHVFGAFEADFW